MQVLAGPGPGVLPLLVHWELVLSGATLGKPDCEVSASGDLVLLCIGVPSSSLPENSTAVALQNRSSKSLQGRLLALSPQPSEAYL